MFCLFRKNPYICKTNIKHKDYESSVQYKHFTME